MSRSEHIDHGFLPDLKKRRLSEQHEQMLERWQMPTVGRPCLAPEGMKAALWHGRANHIGEIPVMAVISGIKKPIIDLDASWFIGVAEEPDIAAADYSTEAYMDAARFRAEGQADAIEKLSILIPPPSWLDNQALPSLRSGA